jgi:hypothetical protein
MLIRKFEEIFVIDFDRWCILLSRYWWLAFRAAARLPKILDKRIQIFPVHLSAFSDCYLEKITLFLI